MIKRSVALLSIILSVAFAVFAQEGNETEILLKKADVEKFINTYPELKTDFEALELNYNEEEGEFTIGDDVAYIAKVNDAVKKQGYTDYVEYFSVAATILTTYAAVTLDTEYDAAQPDIQEAIDAIKNNPTFTAEQKEQMLAMLNQSSQMYAAVSGSAANSENVAVVKPYTEQLNKLLEEE